jgi:hypothetical protein
VRRNLLYNSKQETCKKFIYYDSFTSNNPIQHTHTFVDQVDFISSRRAKSNTDVLKKPKGTNINPFRFYVEPRPTVWFSCCAPMSEDVRRGFVAFVRPLSEPVRRFSSCSTDFNQQIAQVVLFLFLYVLLF